ncbi:exosortase-dependent surface protein XDP2 [Anabaena sp. UHCC 0204]|uniref:exosortase-dependent surface protein XDP2 n=1 Tax=Anabaena sp. UHCC 0204 TaxID=2590009 RepID=UPI001444DE4F|nr:exosortase-dependent surface protein XDP2 [Anabaena sp. UHCC 0204]MTJ07513.1 PEP-CTERM sorting domain-containing protein [Anabaena sp. UHCC 0204]
MKVKNLLVPAALVISSVLAMSASAQAATFTTQFTQNNGAKGDTWLNSVTQNGKTISNFSLVNSANIISNDTWTHNNTGAASTDKGDNASNAIKLFGTGSYATNENPTNAEIAAYLGNKNLNNIIDTEDNGAFNIKIFFDSLIKADDSGLDSLFFWERGKNSDLRIRALDASGNAIGNALKLLRGDQSDAGYQINTKEIGGSQNVGSWGVSLAQLGVTQLSGLKLTANDSFDGPDFKVVARKTTPEPGAMMGLGAVATLAFLRRRQQNQAAN